MHCVEGEKRDTKRLASKGRECPGPKSWRISVKRWQFSGVSSAGSQERPLAFSQPCDKVHRGRGTKERLTSSKVVSVHFSELFRRVSMKLNVPPNFFIRAIPFVVDPALINVFYFEDSSRNGTICIILRISGRCNLVCRSLVCYRVLLFSPLRVFFCVYLFRAHRDNIANVADSAQIRRLVLQQSSCCTNQTITNTYRAANPTRIPGWIFPREFSEIGLFDLP